MLSKKIVKFISVAAIAVSIGSVFGVTTASAKTYKSKVYAAKQLSHHQFKKTYVKYATKGLIYTTRSLKHWKHNAANYPRTKWFSTQSVTVRKSNGKKAVYYYVTNKSNGIKGWIWRGYLRDGKLGPSSFAINRKINKDAKKITPKKVTGVKSSMTMNQILNRSVSNTNANGFSKINDLRKGLQKWNYLMQTQPDKFEFVSGGLKFAKMAFDTDYPFYKAVVTNDKSNGLLKLSQQSDVIEMLSDVKYYTTLTKSKAEFGGGYFYGNGQH